MRDEEIPPQAVLDAWLAGRNDARVGRYYILPYEGDELLAYVRGWSCLLDTRLVQP